ncbi:hypothetical protein SDC9_187627 [bioreactor metagenome]|uniref:Uncharacterized protein n=1 Tax=bioreactor metagenome TaxID=1076179 RepID=A0A645HNR0_9ZZZZ
MAVDILVVVSLWQVAVLHGKSTPTGIVRTRCAIAVPPPIPKGNSDFMQLIIICQHSAAFTHGHVMSGIEADCSKVTKSADHSSVVS